MKNWDYFFLVQCSLPPPNSLGTTLSSSEMLKLNSPEMYNVLLMSQRVNCFCQARFNNLASGSNAVVMKYCLIIRRVLAILSNMRSLVCARHVLCAIIFAFWALTSLPAEQVQKWLRCRTRVAEDAVLPYNYVFVLEWCYDRFLSQGPGRQTAKSSEGAPGCMGHPW